MKAAISNKFRPANNDPPRYNNDRRSVHKATRVNEANMTDVAKNAVGTILYHKYHEHLSIAMMWSLYLGSTAIAKSRAGPNVIPLNNPNEHIIPNSIVTINITIIITALST